MASGTAQNCEMTGTEGHFMSILPPLPCKELRKKMMVLGKLNCS